MKEILSVTTTKTRTVSMEQISDKYAYYESHVVEVKGDEEISNIVTRGFATIENVSNVKDMNSISWEIPVDWMYERKAEIVGLTFGEYDDIMSGKALPWTVCMCQLNPKYEPEKYKYYLWNDGSHKLADLDGKPVCVPEVCNYMEAQITDAYYDLPKLLAYLKADPARFIPCRYEGNDEIEIFDIPYYNASDYNGYKEIRFMYIPTEAEADAIKKMDHFRKYQYLKERMGLGEYEINKN